MKIITNKYTGRLTYTRETLITLKQAKGITWWNAKQTWTLLKLKNTKKTNRTALLQQRQKQVHSQIKIHND